MEGINRREFLQGAALGAAGMAAGGAMTALSPKVGYADEAEAEEEATAGSDTDAEWDYEADFVVVGSGTACYGALAAADAGSSAIIVEKASALGGTTRLSGCAVWVPLNEHQVEEGYGEDDDADTIVSYLIAGDVFEGSDEEAKRDYVENAATYFKWVEENWNIKQAVYTVLGDYTDLPGSKAMGRSLIHVDDEGESLYGTELFSEKIEPLLEEKGVATLLNTQANSLIMDDGRVTGIYATAEDGSEIAIKANKGVLLGAGGFDRNEDMRKAYLRGPIYGSSAAEGNTGDGQIMGMAVGASLANMASVWQCPFYQVDDSDELSLDTDWFEYGGLPGSITVNHKGKRFTDENSAYGVADYPFWNYDITEFGLSNIPGYQICDADHVSYYGWPGYLSEKPDWFEEYETIDELAEACGIDADALKEEIERFNGFCETGVDEDFGRGEGAYGQTNVAGYGVERDDLINPCMAPVATAPFYVAKVVPGSIGTAGGLRTDTNACVLDHDGNVIEGLYACGNNSGAIFGSIYPGAGGTVGPGFYRAIRAAEHACGSIVE